MSEDDKESLRIVGGVIIFVSFFVFIGYAIGFSVADQRVRQEAVDNHAATWECDQKGGMPHIKWGSK